MSSQPGLWIALASGWRRPATLDGNAMHSLAKMTATAAAMHAELGHAVVVVMAASEALGSATVAVTMLLVTANFALTSASVASEVSDSLDAVESVALPHTATLSFPCPGSAKNAGHFALFHTHTTSALA